jgi:hypothetical protein
MNSNLKRIGAGVAGMIAGTALILTPIGADAGVDTHVEHSCIGTAFDVVCFHLRPPTKPIANCLPLSERGISWSTSQRDGLRSHPAWC